MFTFLHWNEFIKKKKKIEIDNNNIYAWIKHERL